MTSLRIGIDLGGTKIEAIALGEDAATLARERLATPQGDYLATIACIVNLVTGIEARLGVRGTVGVATPGAIAPGTGIIKNANSVCLNGQPLQADLEAALGRPVRLANDANCFALSEAVDGAAAEAEVVFGVIIGTGTGGGIVVRGLASVINLLDPDVIVLGGGLSQIERLYHNVPRRWGEYVFAGGVLDEKVRTRLCSPLHGDSSGVRGAAWLWPQ